MSTNSDDTHTEETNWELHVMNNRYIILKKIGFGSYATVWLSFDVVLMNYNAIKISNPEDYKTCLKETNVYKKIKEYDSNFLMNIETFFDYKRDDELYHCEIMNLMGNSLYKHIKQKKMSFNDVVNVLKQILLGLKQLHDNDIIHGDLKPENILLTELSQDMKNFMNVLNIEKIIKNKTYFLDVKNRKKIMIEIKKRIDTTKSNSQSEISEDISSDISDINIVDHNSDSESEIWSISSYEDCDNCEIYKKSTKENICNTNILDNTDNNLKIKITDMGGCVLADTKRKKQIQTCYYMSPEILLRLPYNKSSDMWALGCTAYEILTGKILFYPDDYNGNEDRFHLYEIMSKLNLIPEQLKSLIEKSRYRDILFTLNCKKIKGFDTIEYFDLKHNIKQFLKSENIEDDNINAFCDFVMKCLDIDDNKRIDVNTALYHPLFE